MTVARLRVLDALILRGAAHRIALLGGNLVLRVARILARVRTRVGSLVGGHVARAAVDLRDFGVGLGLRMRSLRLLHADVLLVARHVVAFFLRDVVVGVGLRNARVVTRAVRILVVCLELGLRDLFLAFGFRVADVLGISRHRRALALVGLVLRLDLVFVGLVHIA